jgi:hypothetical protein
MRKRSLVQIWAAVYHSPVTRKRRLVGAGRPISAIRDRLVWRSEIDFAARVSEFKRHRRNA